MQAAMRATQLGQRKLAVNSGRLSLASRTYATAVATPSSSGSTPSALPDLGSIEASWKSLTPADQESVFKHLETLQKKDWKELSLNEKKAAYYVSFGPHGPREPIVPPGSNVKIFFGTLAAMGAAVGVFALIRSQAPPKIHTITKEWEEATEEMKKGQKMDPFTGAASRA